MDFSLHALFAQTMDARLDGVKAIPHKILLAGGDGGESRALLAKRYPAAQLDAVVADADWAAAERNAARAQRTWRQKLFNKPPQITQQPLAVPLPENHYDCIWSNLSLPLSDTEAVLAVWERSLCVEGMLFFATFGTDTLGEIRTLLPQSALPGLRDMHDIGDELLRCSFADPVTDMEKRTLSYRTPQRFWQDMVMLGLDKLLPTDAASRQIIDEAIDIGRLSTITLEIVYGHAIKQQRLPEQETLVQFYRTKPTFE